MSSLLQHKNRIILLITVVIFIGVFLIVAINFNSYSRIIKEDILNISKLTSTNIYSKINNELIKPIFVSLTMANDSFVKSWFENEEVGTIEAYLEGIRQKYNYNSTFLISSKSLNYYHYNGLFKQIDPGNAHDIWYYNFIESGKAYELDIDHDEVDNHLLTIFVNCRIAEGEKSLGVTGVGVKVDYIQKIIDDFENLYSLEAFLIDSDGVVQVHSDGSQIETRNIFLEELYKDSQNILLKKNDKLNIYEANIYNTNDYIISYYIKDFDWYLVVRKDTSVLWQTFFYQMIFESIIFLFVTGIVLFVVTSLIKYNERKFLDLSRTDPLTGLLNRRGFDISLKRLVDSEDDTDFTVFLFDVDNFKIVNDKHGHLQGDKVLKRVVEVFNNERCNCIFARWGGDEFSGILFENLNDSMLFLNSFRQKIESDSHLKGFDITISVGLVKYSAIDTEESLMRKADREMYRAKSAGKNRVSY